MPERVAGALLVQMETRDVEFKQVFDPGSTRDWCELLKDMFALANSGGGVVVFGVDNGGTPLGTDVTALAALDPAKITDKIQAYTGLHFDDFRLVREEKNGQAVVCLELQEAATPLVPLRPGTYSAADGKGQERAFSVGVVYVRHGAKSEPANSTDLRRVIDRRVAAARRDLLRNVRRVVAAPVGSQVDVLVPAKKLARATLTRPGPTEEVAPHLPVDVRATTAPEATPVRITTDPAAAAYQLLDPDKTHPYRMAELLKKVNSELARLGLRLSPYDIHAINDAHAVFGRIEFSYKPQYGSRKYSDEFARWLVEQLRRNAHFHILARARRRRQRRNAKRVPNKALPRTAPGASQRRR